MRRRNGFSLIEMLLTMSVGGVLMVLAMSLLQQAMSLSSQARDQSDESRAANRLCEQFRRDAHAASEFTLDADLGTSFTLNESRISYKISDSRVTREQFSNTNSPSVRTHHEEFDLGDDNELFIERLEQPERVKLTIRHHTPLKHLDTRVDRQIAAVIGRLHIDTPTTEVQP